MADTTVWSHFAHAGKPRLVPAAYPGVASPQKILDECYMRPESVLTYLRKVLTKTREALRALS